MDIIKLKARSRAGRGKGYTHKARTAGWLPAICYGHGQESLSIEVDAHEFERIVRTKQTTHLIDLGLGQGGESPTVIKDMQRNVLRLGEFLHVDFQRVSMTEKITVTVPLEVTGLPVGVKESGGILEHPVREVTVSCLPASIPEKIVVDVSNLGINQSIHIRDVHVEGVDILNSPEEVVAVVSIPKAEIVAEPTAAEVAVEGAVAAEGAEGAAPAEGAEGAAQPQPDGKAEKGDKGGRPEKGEKGGRPEKGDKGEKGDKKDRKDRK